ncbi:pyridoxal phosphate phosphatase PHOSPHO2 [Drosophila obscura]|uniref:pyridoxal phosphate phosphatase PHOSPHO2 n=1 Tax=Drosophila obscura TaxID=7282 RepID=UPI001BB12142|nr:pyridoxal phosphate phosphatase PHOSPHO2 [Drosophila obscura]
MFIILKNSVPRVTGNCFWRCPRLLYQKGEGEHVGSRILVAFDFDKTIIEQDSYLVVSQLLPKERRNMSLLEMIPKFGWQIYINRVLHLLHEEHKLDSRTAVGQQIRRIPAVSGMLHLMRCLNRTPTVDMCIISDANTFFINEWLESYGISCLFTDIKTNAACVQANGSLLMLPYEDQIGCDLCARNLCKGGVLQQMRVGEIYKQVVYVGDSCNDLCPMKRLRPGDVACIRLGFELQGKMVAHTNMLCCSVLGWRDGHDLEKRLMPRIAW